MKDIILGSAKALTALIASALSLVVLKWKLHLSDEVVMGVASFVVSTLVYLVPNKSPEPATPPPSPSADKPS